jgi:glycerol-3-phosphate acyltransferase PlsY
VDRSLVAAAEAVLLGYLLGSILPAYLVARARGIEIRTLGSGNPGITNVAETMGYAVAALIAPYDVLKAPIAMVAALALGVSPPLAYLAGAAAFLGHRAPFYLRFRGGEGIAPLVGIAFFSLAMLVRRDPGFWILLAPLLAAMALAFFTRMRQKPSWLFVFGFLPLLVNAALLDQGIDVHTAVLLVIGVYVVGHRIWQLLEPKLAVMPDSERKLLRRKWLRPLAVAFPLGALWAWTPTLIVLGLTLAVFAVSEALRFRARYHRFPLPYRQSERERISSMVMFLLGAFVTLAFFPTEIASLAVLFLIFGDLLAWCIGQTVGGPGFLDKTWAGTAACLIACVTLVSLYSAFGLVSLPVGLFGAVCATAVAAAPIHDDNFVVPVSSAIAMALV